MILFFSLHSFSLFLFFAVELCLLRVGTELEMEYQMKQMDTTH